MKRSIPWLSGSLVTLLAATLLWSGAAAWSAPTFSDQGMTPSSRSVGAAKTGAWSRFNVAVSGDKSTYKVGDAMDITVKANRNCYIMVYCVGTDGKTSIICPSAFSPKNHLTANVPFKLRDTKGKKLQQFGPAGTETVQVVATDRPINVKQLLAKVQAKKVGGTKPAAVTPAETPAAPETPDAPETPSTPGGTTDTAPNPGAETATTDNATIGSATAPPTVGEPEKFIPETEALIRGFVVAKSRSIGPAQMKAAAPQNAVYGLATLKYKVVK